MPDQFIEAIERRLAESRKSGLYPYNLALSRSEPTRSELDGRSYLAASSYDYLSLIGHPDINKAARAAIMEYGTSTGGVRLLTGSTPAHFALEEKIATLYQTEDAVTFSSGYFANIAAMAVFGSRRATTYVDALAHRSIIDACALSSARMRRFRHNDVQHLKELLASNTGDDAPVVFVESIYSMDGDLAPLAEIAAAARAAGAKLLVDDAHGLGVLETPCEKKTGRFELQPDDVDAWIGSLSKAVPSNGGFIAVNTSISDLVRHLAAPYIYSAASTPPNVAAATAALEIIRTEDWRRRNLRANIRWFTMALDRPSNGHPPESPIFPIHYKNEATALMAAAYLKDKEILATPIVAPAVGLSRPRLRICINAAHNKEDIARLSAAINVIDRDHAPPG